MTAIEWLAKELESYGDPGYCKLEWETLDLLVQKAKEMEQQQIMDAWNDGFNKVAKLIKDATQRNLNL